jgi:hypothetical protein
MVVEVAAAGLEQQEVLAVVAAVALQTPVADQFPLKFLILRSMQLVTETQQAHQQEILVTHKIILEQQAVAVQAVQADQERHG